MMFGERLKSARVAKGFSMRKLAEMARVSHNAIKKYEKNEMMPDSTVLIRLADATEKRIDFFFRESRLDIGDITFRCRKNVPKKWENTVKEKTFDVLERYVEVERLVAIEIKHKESIPSLQIKPDDLSTVETAAEKLRVHWQLGDDAIVRLLEVLEDNGIKVINIDVPEKLKIDGLCTWIDSEPKIPVIVLDGKWPTDRIRFTAAHEVGHLVLNSDDEKIAHRFAGAFLYPQKAVVRDFGEKRKKITWRELADTKRRYGISMQATMYRLRDLGIISNSYFQTLYSQFKDNGWFTNEPYKLQSGTEKLFRMKRLLIRALQEDIISESKASELLSVPKAQLKSELSLENF